MKIKALFYAALCVFFSLPAMDNVLVVRGTQKNGAENNNFHNSFRYKNTHVSMVWQGYNDSKAAQYANNHGFRELFIQQLKNNENDVSAALYNSFSEALKNCANLFDSSRSVGLVSVIDLCERKRYAINSGDLSMYLVDNNRTIMKSLQDSVKVFEYDVARDQYEIIVANTLRDSDFPGLFNTAEDVSDQEKCTIVGYDEGKGLKTIAQKLLKSNPAVIVRTVTDFQKASSGNKSFVVQDKKQYETSLVLAKARRTVLSARSHLLVFFFICLYYQLHY